MTDAEIADALKSVEPVEEEQPEEDEPLGLFIVETDEEDTSLVSDNQVAPPGTVSKDGRKKKGEDGKWKYIPTGRKRGRPKKEVETPIVQPETVDVFGDGLLPKKEIKAKHAELLEKHHDKEHAHFELVRWRVKNDLYWFAADFLGLARWRDPDTGRSRVDPIFHKKLCEQLSYREPILILVPRDHCKTTFMCALLAQEILRDPDNVRILYISASAALVEAQMNYVCQLFIQPTTLYYFSDIVPQPGKNYANWDTKRAQDLTLKRSPKRLRAQHQLACRPYNSLLTGMHYDILAVDDAQDEKSSGTDTMRQKSAERITLLSSILDPGGRFVMCGTRWHQDDIYGRIMGTSLVKHRVVHQATEVPAHIKNPVPLPEGVQPGDLDDPNSRPIYSYYTKEMLREKKANTFKMDGRYTNFWAQYYQTPRSPEDIMFKQPIRTYQNIMPSVKARSKKFLAMDTSNTAHTTSDYNGMVVVYRAPGGTCYVEEAVNFRGLWEDALFQLIGLAVKHGPVDQIIIETTLADNFMSMYKRTMELYLQNNRNKKLPIIPRPKMVQAARSANKTERVDMLFGASYRTETCVIQQDQKELIDQMIEFPTGKFDDLVDATATALGAANPAGITVFHTVPQEEERPDLIRDYLRGKRPHRKGWHYGREFKNYVA